MQAPCFPEVPLCRLIKAIFALFVTYCRSSGTMFDAVHTRTRAFGERERILLRRSRKHKDTGGDSCRQLVSPKQAPQVSAQCAIRCAAKASGLSHSPQWPTPSSATHGMFQRSQNRCANLIGTNGSSAPHKTTPLLEMFEKSVDHSLGFFADR